MKINLNLGKCGILFTQRMSFDLISLKTKEEKKHPKSYANRMGDKICLQLYTRAQAIAKDVYFERWTLMGPI